eukprot:UC4_evm7s607
MYSPRLKLTAPLALFATFITALLANGINAEQPKVGTDDKGNLDITLQAGRAFSIVCPAIQSNTKSTSTGPSPSYGLLEFASWGCGHNQKCPTFSPEPVPSVNLIATNVVPGVPGLYVCVFSLPDGNRMTSPATLRPLPAESRRADMLPISHATCPIPRIPLKLLPKTEFNVSFAFEQSGGEPLPFRVSPPDQVFRADIVITAPRFALKVSKSAPKSTTATIDVCGPVECTADDVSLELEVLPGSTLTNLLHATFSTTPGSSSVDMVLTVAASGEASIPETESIIVVGTITSIGAVSRAPLTIDLDLGNSGESADDAVDSCKTIKDNPSGTYWVKDTNNPQGVAQYWCENGWTYASEGEWFKLDYTGGTQTIVTQGEERATYRFILFGARGGTGQGSGRPGYGGKVKGDKEFEKGTVLFVEVGGVGGEGGPADQTRTNPGGYNGGGVGTAGGSGGGGATDVRTENGNLQSRFIVAGGGGGCGDNACGSDGGDGGGLVGGNGKPEGQHPSKANGGHAVGFGGTQTSGGTNDGGNSNGHGSFGIGGSKSQVNDEGGGGGGWYGGGASGEANGPAGGGSSYYGDLAHGSTTPGVNQGPGYAEYIWQ